tara:strand:- start:76 stop:555 length:480 start_codon:yes stop_codon:yes gene_type:complete
MAYRQACLDIVRRHNPKTSKQEIYSEFEWCLQLARQHNYPSKALLSLFCYGYFCPTDLNNEIKPVNIKENTIDMTEFFKSLQAMEDERLKSIYKNCIKIIAENKPDKEQAEFRSKAIEGELKRRLILRKKNNLKGSDVFIAIIGICAFCTAMGSLIGVR